MNQVCRRSRLFSFVDSIDTHLAWKLFRRIDNRFVEKYVAYHYHRSHGWCPKPGLKFGSDWYTLAQTSLRVTYLLFNRILYKKGPEYHHASYQVIVVCIDRESFSVDGDRVRIVCNFVYFVLYV